MARSDVEAWRVDSPSRPCAYCRQDVGADPGTSCPRCEAVYHPDCWTSNLNRCAIYGCEPAPKLPPVPAPLARPILQAPELPRTGSNWAWLAPVFIVAVLSVARLGSNPSPPRYYPAPLPFPPPVPRPLDHSLEIEALMDLHTAVIPAWPDEVPCLLEEAQALETSTSALLEMPAGPLPPDVRAALRETLTADLLTLKKVYRLYKRCDRPAPESGHTADVARVATTIAAKRRLLLDLWTVREPD